MICENVNLSGKGLVLLVGFGGWFDWRNLGGLGFGGVRGIASGL